MIQRSNGIQDPLLSSLKIETKKIELKVLQIRLHLRMNDVCSEVIVLSTITDLVKKAKKNLITYFKVSKKQMNHFPMRKFD